MQNQEQEWFWHYTMGLPDECGAELVTSGSPTIEIVENGLRLYQSTGYVSYIMPIEFCNNGIMEIEISFLSFSQLNGVRMILCNKTEDSDKGTQIFVNDNGTIRYSTSNGMAIYTGLEKNRFYKLKIQKINGISSVFVDGQKVYDTDDLKTKYASANKFFSQNTCEVILKSIYLKVMS